MDDGLRPANAWIAEREVQLFGNVLGINSGKTSPWPQPNNQDLRSENKFLDDGIKLIDAWMAGGEVQAFNNAHSIDSGWPERINQDFGSENGFLADWQGQTPLATGVSSNGAFNITPDHEMVPGWTTSQEEQGRRVLATEPGGQAPGATVNGVALRLPQLKLPSHNPSGIASGSNAQEISTKVSAGTNLIAERKAACILQKVYADSK